MITPDTFDRSYTNGLPFRPEGEPDVLIEEFSFWRHSAVEPVAKCYCVCVYDATQDEPA